MSESWKVYVIRPRPSGKEGANYTLRARPPKSLRSAGTKPIRKSAETEDRAEARAVADRMERDLNSQVMRGDDPLVLDVLAQHGDWRAATECPASTVTAYRQAHRRLVAILGGVRGDDLTRALVLRVQDELRRTLGPGTVNQTLNCARRAWRWALDREWAKAPWPAVRRLPVPETAKRPFSDAEVEAVLAWVATYRGGRWLPLFATLADSAARVGELLSMRGAQVDREGCALRLGRTKTGQPRTLRLPPATMALVPEARPDQIVFRQARHGFALHNRPMSARNTLGVLWRAVAALGLAGPETLDQHSFRRSWISSAHEEGVPMSVSMRATGHRSTRVHLDYARRAAHDVGAAVDAVHARRRRGSGPRPWESNTAQNTAHTAQDPAPNSSAFPPGSRPRASCWSIPVGAQEAAAASATARRTAHDPEQESRAGALESSPFLSGHPLGDRIGALVAGDPEAWIESQDEALRGDLVRALAALGVSASAPAKKRAKRSS